MKCKIRLDTMRDIHRFVEKVSTYYNDKIIVTDNNGLAVNAKSVMGMIYAIEFHDLWCVSDRDIYSAISEFVIEE